MSSARSQKLRFKMSFIPNLSATVDLKVPKLHELANAILPALKENFAHGSVSVTDCPDLREFGLAYPYFGETATIADVGGPGNICPAVLKHKRFDVGDICAQCNMPDAALVIGPGAGPYHHLGYNTEMMCNVCLSDPKHIDTYVAKVDPATGSYVQQKVNDTTEFLLMANLLMTSGPKSQVVHIKAECRKGELNFTDCIRHSLAAKFGDQLISLGGVFRITNGRAYLHVMPDFPTEPITTGAEVNAWLKYYDMNAPLTCLSVLHSCDPGLDLRMEHTHCFSEHGDAGHYHWDTTPDVVEYEGWFVPASTLYRIDQIAEFKG